MTVLVTGTVNSGKSALAEDIAMHTGDSTRYYLATMKICDEEGRRRVIKHRKQREGKGFITVEMQYNIGRFPEKITSPESSTVLLECVSNLVGNEMHEGRAGVRALLNDPEGREGFADGIAEDIGKLARAVNNLVIVTNSYEDHDEGYDEETALYVKLLDMVNERLALIADRTYDLKKEKGTGI